MWGAGPGAWGWRRRGRGVRGTAAAREMIEQARRKAAKAGAKADFRVALIEELPFGEAEFDLVLSSFMLHHLPDGVKRKGLAEVRRVLKPGGRFLAVGVGGARPAGIRQLLAVLG